MVAPFDIDDSIPVDYEIRQVVTHLRLHKSPGPSGLTADNLREWLDAATRPQQPNSTPWDCLVSLIQHMFTTAQSLATCDIPDQMAWSFLTLLPKSDGGVRGIGLLETTWKVC